MEAEHGKRVYTVLQLRVHPALLKLREEILAGERRHHRVILRYITSRGTWYRHSWKGDPEKSGGIAANIGVHFFDMLIWIFGPVRSNETHISDENRMGGTLTLDGAKVDWFLSIDGTDLPPGLPPDQQTYRSVSVDGKEVEFSGGFTDLHTQVYREVLEGRGFSIEDARPAIELVHSLRNRKT